MPLAPTAWYLRELQVGLLLARHQGLNTLLPGSSQPLVHRSANNLIVYLDQMECDLMANFGVMGAERKGNDRLGHDGGL